MEYIAYVETPYKEKFGIPRQSGLAESTCGEIIFTPKFRNPDAVESKSFPTCGFSGSFPGQSRIPFMQR